MHTFSNGSHSRKKPLILVSVGSWSETESICLSPDHILSGEFNMHVKLRHIVGMSPEFGSPLALTNDRQIQWINSKVLAPNTYLVVGSIVSTTKPHFTYGRKRRTDLKLVLDCGLPINMVQVGGDGPLAPPPYVPFEMLSIGKWLACLGRLTFTLRDETQPGISVRAVARRILDLDGRSPTFGRLIPWDFGRPLPYDESFLEESPNYFLLEVVDDIKSDVPIVSANFDSYS